MVGSASKTGTTDKNLTCQQNLKSGKIALVVLGEGQWGLMKPHVPQIVAEVTAATPGSFTEVEIPYADE